VEDEGNAPQAESKREDKRGSEPAIAKGGREERTGGRARSEKRAPRSR